MEWWFRVPSHITGFFKPVITDELETTGSIGAGFSIQKYVYTSVLRDKESSDVKVYFNKKDATKIACTTLSVVKKIMKIAEIDNIGLKIYHNFEIPIGCGLASSGAGALGAAFSINRVLELNIPRDKLVMIAHKAEIECKTGLGSVMGQFEGMFEVRVKAGGPGFGKVARFPMNEKVAILIYGPIETRDILSSRKIMERISKAFGNKHIELLDNFSLENFIKLSKAFATSAKLINNRVEYLLRRAKNIGLEGSMLMVGEGVFLFSEDLESRINQLLNDIPVNLRPHTVIITEIDNEGIREVSK